ncbi:MAG: hypothetical protein C4518_07445 [Desulfobacteraceae bacterium]|nr:MAG: hypothetical protein C4518_07445 [Desulfobacteraceae bacterium]
MQHFSPLQPDIKERAAIEQASRSGFYKCWACGTCDGGCPVNINSHSLRPQKIVRLAYIGLLDELLHLPEIWYCLTCRRCSQICPNLVKPCDIIGYVRREMLRRGIVSSDQLHQYQQFFAKFQRVRWHAVSSCMDGCFDSLSDSQWNHWLSMPVPMLTSLIKRNGNPVLKLPGTDGRNANPSLCFTCSECSSACPVYCERGLFDPQAVVRMVNLGLVDELLVSPSIWLCLGCERCADTCPQTVKAHQVISQLRNMAISRNIVDLSFEYRLRQADRIIYPRFFKEIDAIFHLQTQENDHFNIDTGVAIGVPSQSPADSSALFH